VQLHSEPQNNRKKKIYILYQRTAGARVSGRNAETQLTPHNCILRGVGQKFRFSELFGFRNCG